MVLSNKKQKLLLRALNLNGGSDSASNLVKGEESQKSSISKREKRRQKSQQVDNNNNLDAVVKRSKRENVDAEKTIGDELKSDVSLEVKKKRKKRKRDEINTTAADNVKENNSEPVKNKKKKKKKKKAKKTKKAKKNVGNEQVMEQKESEPNVVAMLDDESKRIEDVVEAVPDKVYVGGIPYYSTEDDIVSYFEQCGTITDIDCMTFPDTGKFRGIAILSFKTEAAAKRALALDGSDMGGLFLKIQPFISAKGNKTSNFAPTVLEGYNRIYVGNLSWNITEDDLKKLFSDCTISSIRFGEDKETGEFKGYAHVDFADSVSLNVALKLDQTVVCGRPVKISCAVPKKGNVSNFKTKPTDNQVDTIKVSEETKPMLKENQINSFNVSEEPKSIPRENQFNRFKISQEPNTMQKQNHLNNFKVSEESKTMQKLNHFDSFKVSEEPKFVEREYKVENFKVNAVSKDEVYGNSVNPVSSSKIRRRTCYECGEKGHLSSACPKKLAADAANAGVI